MLTLGLVSYISGKRVDHPPSGAHMVSLLPGDIKYDSPSGNFRFLLPHHDINRHQHRSDCGALALLLGNSFNLSAGTERLCDVAEGRLLGVADLHAPDPRKPPSDEAQPLFD